MKTLAIAYKDLLITLKDRKAMVQIILFPLLLIFVLGLSLSNAFNTDAPVIKQFEMAVVDQDGGAGAQAFMTFLERDDIQALVTFNEMTEAAADEAVKSGDIPAMVLIPEGYSEATQNGSASSLKVSLDPGSPTKASIVESIVKGYANSISSIDGIVKAADVAFGDYGLDSHMVIEPVMNVLTTDQKEWIQDNNIEGKKYLSAIQYYSAGMLVMFIMFVGMLGTSSVIEEREQRTLMRLMGTNASNKTIIVGKLLGIFILGVFNVSILIVATTLLFKVHWGSSIIGLILLSAAMIYAAAGLAMFLATLFKSSKAVNSVNPVVIMILSFLGGSMFPIYGMPEAMQNFAKLTLNNWALRGYMSLMLNNGVNAILTPIFVLLGIGTVLLFAGVSRLRIQ